MTHRRHVTFHGRTATEAARFIREESLRMTFIRRVIVEAGRARVQDVNRNELIFPGVTFGHPLLETVLREAGASFNPATLGEPPPTADGMKEFGCSAKYPWAHDRIS